MKQIFAATMLAASVTSSLHVQAQELPIAPGAFKGFDGVSAECIVQTPDAFATGTCKMLFASAARHAGKAGVKMVQAGTQVWEDVDVKDRAHLELPAGSELASPVRLTFFVRGANSSGVTGGFTRMAIWTPAEVDGRKGKLVLWETATLGTGPRNGLRKALVKSVAAKLEAPFSAIAADNKAD